MSGEEAPDRYEGFYPMFCVFSLLGLVWVISSFKYLCAARCTPRLIVRFTFVILYELPNMVRKIET